MLTAHVLHDLVVHLQDGHRLESFLARESVGVSHTVFGDRVASLTQ